MIKKNFIINRKILNNSTDSAYRNKNKNLRSVIWQKYTVKFYSCYRNKNDKRQNYYKSIETWPKKP